MLNLQKYEALIELLEDKGIITKKEVLERAKQMREISKK